MKPVLLLELSYRTHNKYLTEKQKEQQQQQQQQQQQKQQQQQNYTIFHYQNNRITLFLLLILLGISMYTSSIGRSSFLVSSFTIKSSSLSKKTFIGHDPIFQYQHYSIATTSTTTTTTTTTRLFFTTNRFIRPQAIVHKHKQQLWSTAAAAVGFINNPASFFSTETTATTKTIIMPPSKKFYAVAIGRNVGVFNTWNEAEIQVKGFPGAKFKSFKNIEEADKFITTNKIKLQQQQQEQHSSSNDDTDDNDNPATTINATTTRKRSVQELDYNNENDDDIFIFTKSEQQQEVTTGTIEQSQRQTKKSSQQQHDIENDINDKKTASKPTMSKKRSVSSSTVTAAAPVEHDEDDDDCKIVSSTTKQEKTLSKLNNDMKKNNIEPRIIKVNINLDGVSRGNIVLNAAATDDDDDCKVVGITKPEQLQLSLSTLKSDDNMLSNNVEKQILNVNINLDGASCSKTGLSGSGTSIVMNAASTATDDDDDDDCKIVSVTKPEKALHSIFSKSKSDDNNNNNIQKRTIKVHIMFDGGSRGNPGLAGSGSSITFNEKLKKSKTNTVNVQQQQQPSYHRVIHAREFLGKYYTNNEAEYQGIIRSLQVTKKVLSNLLLQYGLENTSPTSTIQIETKLFIQGDSDLIIKQLNKEYQVRNIKLQKLYKKVVLLIDSIKTFGTCTTVYEHVYREHNKIADGLGNEAMDAQRSWITTSDDNHQTQHSLESF